MTVSSQCLNYTMTILRVTEKTFDVHLIMLLERTHDLQSHLGYSRGSLLDE